MTTKIEELYDEIREYDAKIVKANKRKMECKENLKRLQIDLIKEGKIKFVEKTFEDWFALCSSFSSENMDNIFWIYSSDTFTEMGVMEGLVLLSKEDRDHFDEYMNDYFYYGYPDYFNNNDDEYSEMSECEIGFEGTYCLKTIDYEDL